MRAILPLASSWQPAKAGPAWWDAPLGLGRCLSFLLHLPQSVPLEWDGGSSVEKLTFSCGFLPPTPSYMSMADTDLLLEFFIQAVQVGLFVFLWRMEFKVWAGLFLPIQ